jgi:hypothetical protein
MDAIENVRETRGAVESGLKERENRVLIPVSERIQPLAGS